MLRFRMCLQKTGNPRFPTERKEGDGVQSVFEEIRQLRGGLPMAIDRGNANRYRVLVSEKDGSTTAYYFSTPIYNKKSRRLIDLAFRETPQGLRAAGSNAEITVSETVRLEDDNGACTLTGAGMRMAVGDGVHREGQCSVRPTANGVVSRCGIGNQRSVRLTAEVSVPFMQVRANDRYFALMREQFVPFVVFSCIGSVDAGGNLIAPATLSHRKLDDRRYEVCLTAASPLAQGLMFEVNLYERKLFQDTTVESGNPTVNNSYGGTGYIGYTEQFGQQWLYTRPDTSLMTELADRRIYRALLHIPALNGMPALMRAHEVSARFCSFGSNWNNKIAGGSAVPVSGVDGVHWQIDLQKLLSDPVTGILSGTDGVILKPVGKNKPFCAIATADSYYAPQILEIRYR